MTALYAVAFLSSLGFSLVIPFMVPLVTRFGGNAFVLGALGASFWSAQLVGSTWLGTLSDRIGRKSVLLRSQLGAMAAWLIFLCALSVPRVALARADGTVTGGFVLTLPLVLIALARITDGFFNGSISVANAYMADVPDDDARKVGYARLGAASSFGFVIGPIIAGLLARTDTGVSFVVVLAIVLSATAALLIRFRLPALAPHAAAAVEVARAGGVRAHKPLGGGCREAVRYARRPVREILSLPGLRPMLALYLLIYLAFSIYTAALPAHAILDLRWSVTKLGLLYTTLALALAGTETYVLPKLAHKLAPPILAAGGSAMLIVAYLLVSLGADAALLIGAVLYGVGNGLMWPSYLAMLANAGLPEYQGAIQGVGSSAGSLASIIGTAVGGVLYVTIGVATFYVSAAAVTAATCLFIAERSRATR